MAERVDSFLLFIGLSRKRKRLLLASHRQFESTCTLGSEGSLRKCPAFDETTFVTTDSQIRGRKATHGSRLPSVLSAACPRPAFSQNFPRNWGHLRKKVSFLFPSPERGDRTRAAAVSSRWRVAHAATLLQNSTHRRSNSYKDHVTTVRRMF